MVPLFRQLNGNFKVYSSVVKICRWENSIAAVGGPGGGRAEPDWSRGPVPLPSTIPLDLTRLVAPLPAPPKRRVRPPPVVNLQPFPDHPFGLESVLRFGQIHRLALQRAPQLLNEEVVHPASPPVLRHLHPCLQQALREGLAGVSGFDGRSLHAFLDREAGTVNDLFKKDRRRDGGACGRGVPVQGGVGNPQVSFRHPRVFHTSGRIHRPLYSQGSESSPVPWAR